MEVTLKRTPAVKGKKRADGSPPGDEVGDTGKKQLEIGASRDDGKRSKSSSPVQKDSSIRKQDDQLETTRAEMGEVKQENDRLKTILSRILKDYHSLQMHFFDILERDKKPREIREEHREMAPESDLVSLSLGRSSSSSGGPKREETMKAPPSAGAAAKDGGQDRSEGLSLSLDCEYGRSSTGSYAGEQEKRNSSRENSLEAEAKEAEEAGEAWPPSKILKNMRSGTDEISQQQAYVKKARVSVRARCDAPTMNDGCQWRKYGQKIAKGNPCPRAYYRCTVAPACPVRKQVQRCAEDMSILITTYEGNHNHPLPVSATAMASTTAAAASMLTSGPSPASPQMIGASPMTASSAAAAVTGLHSPSFCLPDVSRQRQLYLPNPSICPSPSFPATITLDLTSPTSSSAAAASAQFHRFSPNIFSTGSRYAPTTFNFSTAEPSSGTPSWGGAGYGAPAYTNKSGQQFTQSCLQKTAINTASAAPPNRHSLTPDTIAAATKAITADPTFQSALAAAITSIVGGQGIQGATETPNAAIGRINHILNWGERLASPVSPAAAAAAASANGTGPCPSSYLTRSTTPHANPAPSTFPQPPLMSISSTKSSSASPIRTREQIN